MERRPYRSDLPDARWAVIGPGPGPDAVAVGLEWSGISQRVHGLRELVYAIFDVTRTGIA